MAVYDNDPIAKFKEAFHKEAKKQGHVFSDEETFDTIVKSMPWVYKREPHKGKSHLDVLLEDSTAKTLYEHIKDWPYSKVKRIYLDKDNLIDDKVVIDGVTVREPKRDRLIQHLFKIQELISLFDNKEYNELIRRTSFSVQCCTRAKDNLIVYYPSPSPNVLEGAINLFGVENCVNLDTD